ncbi:MAG: 5'-methylthioadenosine phosphorylase [Deltaproteobacteria bacterium CG_4_9_14_3_um_filter_63_12]|nr:MAG: 5'-methylthioadenosine phosphorylase [Deltaproteobacteria bacterium CG_4_9_14_3_um_filter_63_12]
MARRSLDFWLTSEDLPAPENRVTLIALKESIVSIAAILGSSFETAELLGASLEEQEVETRWGSVRVYKVPDAQAFVVFRHGVPHRHLPHQVNTRAHIAALARLGVEALLVTSSVGVLDAAVPLFVPLILGDLLMPDNRLPSGEVCTFFSESTAGQGHLVFDEGPFNHALSSTMRRLARRAGTPIAEAEVVFGYVPGPRTKTRAENAYWARMGAQVNSMSLGPEVILANEVELPVVGLVVGHKYSLPEPSLQRTDQDTLGASLRSARQALEELVWRWLHAPTEAVFGNHLYRFGS